MSLDARRSHAGDEYQLRIATHWLVRLLQDKSLDSVLVEAVSVPGETRLAEIDDIVIINKDGTSLFAQAKKNQTDHKAWAIDDPVLATELVAARDQLEGTPRSRVIFYSRTPFGALAKLLQDGPAYLSFEAFAASASATLLRPLAVLASVIGRSEAQTFDFLPRMQIGSHAGFEEWDQLNTTHLKSITTNPVQALRLLEALIRGRQSGLAGAQSPFRRDEIIRALEKDGIYLAGALDLAQVRREFARASAIGRHWVRTIRGATISRPDTEALIEAVRQQSGGSILLTDGPGTGKTCVLLGLVEALEHDPIWDILFIRGDEFAECSSDRDLSEFGLPADFIAKCAALAQEKRVLVVIDSLDVLSIHGEHQSLRALLSAVDRLLRVANVTCERRCLSLPFHSSDKGDVE